MADKKINVVGGESTVGVHIDNVLRTESGRVLWGLLFDKCGYNKSSLRISRSTGELLPLSIEAAEARRLLYLELRELASRELLYAAEQLAENPVPAAKPKEEERK